MEDGPFSSKEFGALATTLVLLLHNTSLIPGEANASLPEQKGQLVCASLCLMDAKGEVLARPAPTVTAIRKAVADCQRLLDLRRTAATATSAMRKELFLLELELGLVAKAAVEGRAAELSLTADEHQFVDRRRTDLAVSELRSRAAVIGPAQVAAGMHALARSGGRPTAATAGAFWLHVLMHCAEIGDGELADEAYAVLSLPSRDDLGAAPEQLARWQHWRVRAHAGRATSGSAR